MRFRRVATSAALTPNNFIGKLLAVWAFPLGKWGMPTPLGVTLHNKLPLGCPERVSLHFQGADATCWGRNIEILQPHSL